MLMSRFYTGGQKMEQVKATENYTVYKKRNGRYAVKGANNKYVNGEDKAKILEQEGLIKLTKPAEKPAEEAAPAEEGEQAEATEE